MRTNDIPVASGLQAPRSGAGLVPYTTSQTSVSGDVSTPFAVKAMLQARPALARLRRLKHHVRTASRLIAETMHREGGKWRAVFVTLTYAPGHEWSPKHVAAFVDNVRKWGTRRGFRVGYLWVAEMQRRGAVHYHAVLWIPSRQKLPRPDKAGWWRHGSTNVQPVQRNATGYLMKYVSKGLGDYPDLPQGARICGSGGLDAMARNEFHYWRLPRYVREGLDAETAGPLLPGQLWDGRMKATRNKGGGWRSRLTGQVWVSAFGLFGIARVSRGLDCNGRPLRDETVCLLSDRWARRAGGAYDWEPVMLALREHEYEQNRANLAALWAAQDDNDVAAVWAFWNQAA